MSARDAAVAVVVPNWNGRELLRHCLQSLQQQTWSHFRTIVVDNGSVDGSVEMLRREFPEVIGLQLDHNAGFAHAANLGIRHSEEPYIALLNNDTETDPHWLQTLVTALERHDQAGSCASRLMDFHDRNRIDAAGDYVTLTGLPLKRGHRELLNERWLRPQFVFGASAAAVLYRRRLFEEIGGFDEDFFMYLEDVDVSFRAQLAGFTCWYEAGSVVYHQEAASDPDRKMAAQSRGIYTARRVYWITRNRLLLLAKNMPDPILARRAHWLAWGFLRSFLFHLGKAGYTGSFLRGLAAGICALPAALRKRRQIQSARRCSLDYLCKVMGE